MVTINQLVDIVEGLAGITVQRNYNSPPPRVSEAATATTR
jgi:hypothetical protein